MQIVRVDELPDREARRDLPAAHRTAVPAAARSAHEFRRLPDRARAARAAAAATSTSRSTAKPAQPVVIKTPSIDLRGDPAYLERFLMEEWIARRINSAHVLKPVPQTRKRNYLYVVTEFIEGQTLTQWMIDNPKPDLETVRGIVEQIAKGLQAFHRLEMLHQDLRPDNIMIDTTGTVKIIDFGATRVAGVDGDRHRRSTQINLLGTAQYAAPEYFLGESGTSRSDLFSLGVIAYQMLSGRLPYGAEVPNAPEHGRAATSWATDPCCSDDREIPAWIDDALRKAVDPDPFERYDELSEFIYDLRHPNQAFLNKTRPPLIERNPVVFWKSVSFVLLVAVIRAGGDQEANAAVDSEKVRKMKMAPVSPAPFSLVPGANRQPGISASTSWASKVSDSCQPR